MWTVWGSAIRRSMQTQNFEIKKLSAILTPDVMQHLEREGTLFGVAWSYYQIKRVLRERQGPHANLAVPAPLQAGQRPRLTLVGSVLSFCYVESSK